VVILASPPIRERAGRAIRDLRARIDQRSGPSDRLEIDADAVPSVEAVDTSVEDLETTTASPAAGEVAAMADAQSETQPDEGPTAMVDVAVAGVTAAATDDGANGST
jgi:hypothetical protein